MTLIDIARGQAQRDLDISRDPSRGSPNSLRELEQYKKLTVYLADANKELKLQVRLSAVVRVKTHFLNYIRVFFF